MAVCLLATIARADVPVVTSVEPPFGFRDEATPITIHGDRFEVGARAALPDGGGPRLLGRVETTSSGMTESVAVAGGFAYVADRDRGLSVVDVCDPGAPIVVGSVDTGSAFDVAVADGYAYVASADIGLQVVDVRDPAAPALAASVGTPGRARAVAVTGGFAYVVGDQGQWPRGALWVLDIREPAAPVLRGSVDTGSVSDIAVADGYAYVTEHPWQGGTRLVIIDVRNSAAPIVVGSVDTQDGHGMAVADGFAYVIGWTVLQVIDVRNPAAPVIDGSVLTYAIYGDVATAGGFAYVTHAGWGEGGLRVIDVHDPSSPVLVGSVLTLGVFLGIAVEDGSAYIADGGGLQVADVRDAALSAFVGSVDIPGDSVAVAVAGELAYVADPQNTGGGLRIVDLRDPSAPVLVGSVDIPLGVRGVAVAGGYAYTAHGWRCAGGLSVVDVRDPTDPTVVGSVASGSASDVAVASGFAYIVGEHCSTTGGFLWILDISDPASPALVGSIDTAGDARAVAVANGFAYVVDQRVTDVGHLYVVDVRDPTDPVIVGSIDTDAGDVAVAGDFAFMTGVLGLQVVDVRDPATPVLVGTADTPGWGAGVAVAGGLAYVADSSEGLQVFDVRDPAAPLIVRHLAVSSYALDVAVAGGFACVARGSGLLVVAVYPPLEDVRTMSATAITATVPAGLVPGPYDVRVIGPSGETTDLYKGFRICERRTLDLSLHPLSLPLPPWVFLNPMSWQAQLDGDERLFESTSRREVLIALPDLPPELDVAFARSPDPTASSVELQLVPFLGRGLVTLTGADEASLRARWAEAARAGGFALPAIDAHRYGEIELTLRRTPEGAAPAATRVGNPVGRFVGQAPIVYRFEFWNGVPSSAHASGPGVDFVFRAEATYDWTCTLEDRVSYVDTAAALCETVAAEYPQSMPHCTLW